MMRVVGEPIACVPRLLEALRARDPAWTAGRGADAIVRAGGAGAGVNRSGGSLHVARAAPALPTTTVIVGALAPGALQGELTNVGVGAGSPPARLLVLDWLGTHPDAAVPALREAWRVEEEARGAGLPVLTLRLAPLVGPTSPLWRWLARRPRLPRGGRTLFCPVAEADVVETLARALSGAARWDGWFEVAGPDPLTFAELAVMAARGRADAVDAAACEPTLAIVEAQRLAESEPWSRHFGIVPRRIADVAAEIAA